MSEQKLIMGVCTECDVRFFVPNPHPDKKVTRIKIHEEAPISVPGRKTIPFKCLRCNHQQFIEVTYEALPEAPRNEPPAAQPPKIQASSTEPPKIEPPQVEPPTAEQPGTDPPKAEPPAPQV